LYWESAIDIPGPHLDRIGEIAQANDIHLVVGVIERAGGTLYCSIVFFAPDGRYLGKHRKLVPTGSERLIWGSGDGSRLPVFNTPLGRLGGVICWENYMREQDALAAADNSRRAAAKAAIFASPMTSSLDHGSEAD
jgi:nitrilase